MSPAEIRAQFTQLMTNLLDAHPPSLSPHIWGPLLAQGRRNVTDGVRVMAATTDAYTRLTLLVSIAKAVDAATARVLLEKSATDWPTVALAWLAHTAGDQARLAEELTRAVEQHELHGESLTLLAALPVELRHRLVAELAQRSLHPEEPLERLDDTRIMAELVGPDGALLLSPLLADFEREIVQNEASLSWDSYYGEHDPRLILAELYGALGRRADAERFLARAEALPYPWQPERAAGATPESQLTRAILDGAPRPPGKTVKVDVDQADRALGDLSGWANLLVYAARFAGSDQLRTSALEWAARLAGTNLSQCAAVLAAGYGDEAAYAAFADQLLARSDANDIAYFSSVALAAPPAIGKRMARHLLRHTFADDFKPLDRHHYRRHALQEAVAALRDEHAAVWSDLQLPVETTELSLLPPLVAEAECERREAAAGGDALALARVADGAMEAKLSVSGDLHRRAVTAVAQATGKIGEYELAGNARFVLSLDADAAELTELLDAMEAARVTWSSYASLFDRAIALGDAALIARTAPYRFGEEPSEGGRTVAE